MTGTQQVEDPHFENLMIAIHATHQDATGKGFKRGNGGKSSLKCPICKTGTINYSVAGVNGHIWARCTSQDCVSFIE